MLPIKHSAIFKSRWLALLWAAGFIWLALDVAHSSQQQQADANGIAAGDGSDVVSGNDVEQVARTLQDM